MADPLNVRPAQATDRAAWLGLWQEWQAHMGGRVPEAVTAASWLKIITPGSGLLALVAWKDDLAAGFANVSLTPFAWTGDHSMFLQDLFVAPSARGEGVGTALLKAVYGEADRLGISQVFWMADEKDAELQAFYDRHAIRSPYVRYLRNDWPW